MAVALKANPESEDRVSKDGVLAVMAEAANDNQLIDTLRMAGRALSRTRPLLLTDSQLEIARDVMENPDKYAFALSACPDIAGEMESLRRAYEYYTNPNVVRASIKMMKQGKVSLKPYQDQIAKYKIKV